MPALLYACSVIKGNNTVFNEIVHTQPFPAYESFIIVSTFQRTDRNAVSGTGVREKAVSQINTYMRRKTPCISMEKYHIAKFEFFHFDFFSNSVLLAGSPWKHYFAGGFEYFPDKG